MGGNKLVKGDRQTVSHTGQLARLQGSTQGKDMAAATQAQRSDKLAWEPRGPAMRARPL